MNKPKEPKKWKLVTNHANYYFNFVSNKVALDVFLDWIKKSVPKDAEDVTIGLENDYYIVGSCDDSITSIGLTWKEKVPNTKYESQMKKYEREMEKWKKCQK
jgi:hypothetical protein